MIYLSFDAISRILLLELSASSIVFFILGSDLHTDRGVIPSELSKYFFCSLLLLSKISITPSAV